MSLKLEHNVVIDEGNTRIKIALFRGGELASEAAFSHYGEALDFLPKQGGNVLASVSDTAWIMLTRSLGSAHRLLRLSRTLDMPIRIDYETPETLGTDRIASAIGARLVDSTHPLLVVDAGTCLTVDLVTADGVFRGGSISPGVRQRLRAMAEFTKALPAVGPGTPKLPGKSTTACLQAGAVQACCFEIEGWFRYYQASFEGLRVVMTGGDHNLLASQLRIRIFAAPNLTLMGLHEILQANAPLPT